MAEAKTIEDLANEKDQRRANWDRKRKDRKAGKNRRFDDENDDSSQPNTNMQELMRKVGW